MSKTWRLRLMFVPPLLAVLSFLYMTFVNSRYEHPGKVTYNNHCASCHGDRGEGTAKLVPPLFNSEYLIHHFEALPALILNGMTDSVYVNGVWYNQAMYPIQLSNVEMANLLNYMNDSLLVKSHTFVINSDWVKIQLSEKSK